MITLRFQVKWETNLRQGYTVEQIVRINLLVFLGVFLYGDINSISSQFDFEKLLAQSSEQYRTVLLTLLMSADCKYVSTDRYTEFCLRDMQLRILIGRPLANHFCSSDKPVCLPFANQQLSGWLYRNATLFLTIIDLTSLGFLDE